MPRLSSSSLWVRGRSNVRHLVLMGTGESNRKIGKVVCESGRIRSGQVAPCGFRSEAAGGGLGRAR